MNKATVSIRLVLIAMIAFVVTYTLAGSSAAREVRSKQPTITEQALANTMTQLEMLESQLGFHNDADDAHFMEALAKAQAKPCSTRPESRQFDFWVGEWDVYNAQGQLAGTNSVQLILGDCVLTENWTGARGGSGKSFNFYDVNTGKWHQLWVDDRGGVLRLDGEYRDGAMRFAGETVTRDGSKTLERLVFTKLSDNRVRQFWEQSKDGGTNWSVVFDGTYIPRKQTSQPSSAAPFYSALSWSPDGSQILLSAFEGKNADIHVMKADGSGMTKLTNGPGVNMWGAFSSDGKRIVFQSNRDGNEEIYVMNADGSEPQRLTNDAGRDLCPSWSPDGKRITFSSSRTGGLHVYVMNADGSNQIRITKDPGQTIKYYNPVWSPDGKRIVFYSEKGDRKDQIEIIDTDGSNQTVLSGNVGNNIYPSWLPDGKRIIFTAQRDGIEGGIFLVTDKGTDLSRIGEATAFIARWSPKGDKIAILGGNYPNSYVSTMNTDGSGVVRLTK